MSQDCKHGVDYSQDAENNLNSSTFERCPHDKENPYVMINRDLTRNADISFQARGFLFYLLSNKEGWVINRSYIIQTQKIGKDKLKSLVDELILEGHISHERFNDAKGHRRSKYLVSEYPRYKEENAKKQKDESKEENPRAENPPKETPHKVNPSTKKEQQEKNLSSKEDINKEEESNARSKSSLATPSSIQFNKKLKILENISIEQMKVLYPNTDIELEIKKMQQWLIDNPKKQKKNYDRFVANWISSAERDASKSKAKPASNQDKNSLFVEECRQDSPEAFSSIRVFGKYVVNEETKSDLFLGIDPETFKAAFLKLAGVRENG